MNKRLVPIKADLAKSIPIADDIYIRCRRCGTVLSTMPEDGQGCICGNVFVDVDYGRVKIDSLNDVELLRVA
jgi:hypothetical protein